MEIIVSSIMESSKTKTCQVCSCAFCRSNERSTSEGVCNNCYKIFKRRISRSILIVPECKSQCEIVETNRSACTLCFLRKCFCLGLTRNGITSIDQLVFYTLPTDNRCPVCGKDLKTRQSIQFNVISCGKCFDAFARYYKRFQAKELSVIECRNKKCVITPDTRLNCAYCWLKKCFKVGFKAAWFNSMSCIKRSSDANQNVKVIDDTLCLAMSTKDPEDSVLALPAPETCHDLETTDNEKLAINDYKEDDTDKPPRQQRRSKLYANFKLTVDVAEEVEDIIEPRKTKEEIEIEFRHKRLAAAAVIAEQSGLLKVVTCKMICEAKSLF